ncbi:hypothetical protein [Phenylobacterium soli]|uniref:Uncharacterized protein n=1 Tax=Phenylobacterium soli TaxID=2170551 RepID=A0A328AN38_9CAUL|nr:hypothetical protein [Phenylobacterium soli]RAK55745.1 hypothetical protein DJ017_15115 [Phenylobacterium soli]
MSDAARSYVLFVENLNGSGTPERLACEDLDSAERTGRELMAKGLRVSIEVLEEQSLLYTLHL